ncbi:hypothetical protein DJ71_21010, partial [Halorubrum sp. E3]
TTSTSPGSSRRPRRRSRPLRRSRARRGASTPAAFLRTPDTRRQVAARLADHVELAERKRRDVDGLF